MFLHLIAEKDHAHLIVVADGAECQNSRHFGDQFFFLAGDGSKRLRWYRWSNITVSSALLQNLERMTGAGANIRSINAHHPRPRIPALPGSSFPFP